MPDKINTAPLSADDLTGSDAVKNCLTALQNKFGAGGEHLLVSDVLDDTGHQYVNLVQKGGGVLGVALLGYTYILEQMNIRFIRLAGTSAGAINTALMCVCGEKPEAKSTKVIEAVCNLNFIDLVDGHPAARWLISKFITREGFAERTKNFLLLITGILVFLFLFDFTGIGLRGHSAVWLQDATKLSFVLTGLLLLGIGVILNYASALLRRLKDSGFGINPGDFFYTWIKNLFLANNISSVSGLMTHAAKPIPGLHLRTENPAGTGGLDGDVTFITSELVSQNKIQFPEMWDLFRLDKDQLQPAGFVRASMAIPVFFESYFINKILNNDPLIAAAWLNRFGEEHPPENARFVDGGILSDFPISIFYNPDIVVPRLPSFGIDLDDGAPGDAGRSASSWSLTGYFGRIFNTIRFYYDKDFLIKNKFFQKGIGSIPLQEFNWLNFFLTKQDKIKMFEKGAVAATDFLMNFDWTAYKADRQQMDQTLRNTAATK